MTRIGLYPAVAAVLAATLFFPSHSTAQTVALSSTDGLQAHHVTVDAVTYQGRPAVRVLPAVPADKEKETMKNGEGGGIVVLQGSEFRDGTIEVDVAGKPRPGAVPDARGFVGVAFRVAADLTKYECFYVRPTNGRAEDQVRRNHSAQYISMPEYEWARLRKEAPERYESYVDLVPGEWTKLKIVVKGLQAWLFVGDAPQPILIVNDLKHGETQGQVALWIGLGSEAYFSNLRITR